MTGPLSTLRVVEFSGIGPAPLAGQLLADLGARVTVIDRKSGAADKTDINRRGKRSIALNLKSRAGLRISRDLIAQSDILIEGFRPGVMERLGLGPEDCPDTLIYGRMTGWGQNGAWARQAGHDINYLAMTGALHAMGASDRPPAPPLNLVADFGGGSMFLVFGLLAAVIARGVSGKGQVVDAAMVDGVPAMMGLIHGFLAQGAWRLERGSNWLDGSSHFYRCYRCADGKFIAVGALEPQFYAELMSILGLNEADLGDQFDRTRWAQNSDILASLFRTRPRDAWAELFAGTDACVAPVLDLVEARHHDVNTERDVFFEQDGVWQARPAPRFGSGIAAPHSAPDAPGAHTAEVLFDLGYTPDDVDTLRKSGALT